MTNTLTDKQKETLEVIETYIITHSFPPTLAELQVLLGVSSNQAVLNHLDALEEKGFIERKKTARGIRLTGESEKSEESVDFLDLLTDMAEKKRQKNINHKKMGLSETYSADEASGKMLTGLYDNEQY